MERKKVVACICAFTLAASLIAADTLPAFAAEIENTTQTEGETGDESESETEIPDGFIYVDDMLYNGYYMDSAGIFYIVTEGVTKPFSGIVNEKTTYYNCDKAGVVTPMMLSRQMMFLEGEVYTGYYMDSAGMLYNVTGGITEPANGVVNEGTKYYSCDDVGEMASMKLSKKTLYVKGKVYTGYYLNNKNKMYSVKKGTLILKTGVVKKGTKYYGYKSKKTKKLSKETLYVKGKAYTGYYLNNKNKMYSVKKGTRTLKTGVVKKGTKYYSYKPKKTKKLSKETLYVKGKVYTGYYLNKQNKMYSVKNGTLVLATGMMSKGTKYYNYKSKKTKKLSKEALYVEGEVYNGYYLGSDNMMYILSNETYTPINTMLNAGTAYYSCNQNKLLVLPESRVYVYGKAVEGLTAGGRATLQKAQVIVQSVSSPNDSKADKLYKCYLWIEKCPYIQYRTMNAAITSDPVDWDVTFANDIFDQHAGCCASLACAFAYMAKACGYENVKICSDTKHAWVDIEGKLYDPLFARDRNFSSNYNAAYTDYRIHPAYTRDL